MFHRRPSGSSTKATAKIVAVNANSNVKRLPSLNIDSTAPITANTTKTCKAGWFARKSTSNSFLDQSADK